MQCLKIKNLQQTEGHSWCTFVSQRAPAEGQEGTGQGMVCTKPNLSLATAPAPSPLQLLCQVSAGQTPPERPKFPSCSRGNTKHRLCINIAAFSTRRFVLAPALCSLLPCLPLPERMRSARRLPKNTPAGNCRGWRAENCRDAARPPQERSTQGAMRALRPLLLPGPAKKILPGQRTKALPFGRCHGCQHVVNYSSGL